MTKMASENSGDGAVQVTDLRIPSADFVLAGRLYRPAGRPAAAVVLNSATGVPQDYYRHFAHWLAKTRGMACLTYDYRDFERSATGPLRRSRATMADWALGDMPAARDEMRRQVPDVPLWVIGHSLGAMVMPSQDGIEDVVRMIGVASGLVHHSDHPWPYQALARMFWFGHVPAVVRMAGYLPGRWLGFGSDLPAGVYWQWRRWCTSRDAYDSEIGTVLPVPDWGRSGAQVDLFALEDDPVIPPQCVWRLAEKYRGGPVNRHLLKPGEHGLKNVGHLGAFARRNAALWPEIVPPG